MAIKTFVASTATGENTIQAMVDEHQRTRDIRAGRTPPAPEPTTKTIEPTDAEIAAADAREAAWTQASNERQSAFNAAAAPFMRAIQAAQEARDKIVVPARAAAGTTWRLTDGTVIDADQYNARFVDLPTRMRDEKQAEIATAQAEVKKLSDADSAKVVKSWNERIKTAAKDIDGWSDMIKSPPRFDLMVEGAIVEALEGPRILMALSEDPALAAKLRALPVRQAIIEIGKMDSRFVRPQARTVTVEASATTTKQIEHDSALGRAKQAASAAKEKAKAATIPFTNSKGEYIGKSLKDYRAHRAAGGQG
jgi:hypothetical protein